MNSYTFHISPYDLAFLGSIFIGLAFALLLWFTVSVNRAANRFLALALITTVLGIAGPLCVDMGLVTRFLPSQFLLATGPLVYFYVRKIVRPGCKFKKKDLIHFSPLLLQFVLVLGIIENRSPVLQLASFISISIYLYLSYSLIPRFNRDQGSNAVDRNRHGLWRLRRLLGYFGRLWLLWAPYIAIVYFEYHKPLTVQYYPVCLLLAAIMIWLAAVAFSWPEVRLPAPVAAIPKPSPSTDLAQKGLWIKNAMKANRLYQDPELSLSSLAEKLDIHTHELSRIINTVIKKNFNDFINAYRVRDAVQKMQDPAYDHITLLGIAYEAGFNSKSTFNRIFKQVTGKSPVEYKTDLKKERPTYNLRRNLSIVPVILHRETTPKWSLEKLTGNYMFKNYLKISWRNLKRNKSYTAINVVGLAVGIAVCMLIFIIIQFQTSFDNFHPKRDRIYRVLTEYHRSGNIYYGPDVPFPLPVAMKTAFPQMEQIATIYESKNDQLLIPDANGTPVKEFKEQRGVFYTGPSFFKMFNFPMLAGSYESLKDPNNVLLTKETADKYFGDWKTAVGKTIKLQAGGFMFEHGTDVLKVSGILATMPANTDFQLKVVVAYGTGFTGDYLSKNTDWKQSTTDFGCYIMLPPNTTVDNFNQQLRARVQKAVPADYKDSNIIQPLSAVHYDTQAADYSSKTISRQLLNVLWLIAAFILLIACVNFINLSTAQAVNRAKEVGVRKVLGSNKSQLQVQFIVETFLIVISAVILAVGITMLALNSVGQLLELSLSFNIFGNPAIILFLLTVTLIVTSLAGFYPSVVLSRFNPVNALQRKLTSTNVKGISLRRGLVVFQFIIAQALIIGTLIIVKQMNYFMDQPLGFDKDAIVNVPFRVDSIRISRLDYLKNQLLKVNGVQAVSFSSNTPVEDASDTWSTLQYDHAIKQTDFLAILKFADNEYVPAYKLPLVAGRNLQPSMLVKEFLVNESLVKSLGVRNPEDILNKDISLWGGQMTGPVVGVVKDFNDRSLRDNLAPLVVTTDVAMYNQAGIKLATANMSATLQSVKNVFDKTFPDFVYEYKFLDDKIANFYKQETQLAALYKIFAAIAIFLSCLGLYGLASFMAVQRIKEVGIRKVLGASAGSIVYLFSKEFILLIAIAFAIAAPIAWYYMHQWLQAYAYRINISWWLFAAGGLAAIIIALATISFQAMKAALANPVRSLRSE